MSAAARVTRAQGVALKAALLVLAAAALVAHLLSSPGLRTAVVLAPLYEGNLTGGALSPASLEAVRACSCAQLPSVTCPVARRRHLTACCRCPGDSWA